MVCTCFEDSDTLLSCKYSILWSLSLETHPGESVWFHTGLFWFSWDFEIFPNDQRLLQMRCTRLFPKKYPSIRLSGFTKRRVISLYFSWGTGRDMAPLVTLKKMCQKPARKFLPPFWDPSCPRKFRPSIATRSLLGRTWPCQSASPPPLAGTW